MGKDYRQTAEEVLQYIGGKDNIEQAAHCVTRLRIALKDESKIDNDKLQSVLLVKGAFHNAGVFQIVIGPGDVDRVYAELITLAGMKEATVADVKDSGNQKLNPAQKFVKVFSDVFMPILPAIVTAGLLMGINNLLGAKDLFFEGKNLLDVYPNLSGLWDLINMMANTAFVFLPALVGWSATKRFGGSPILGIVMGLMLVHPALLNAWDYGKAATGLDGQKIEYFDILGLFQIEKVGYQGQILPVLVAAFVLSKVEIFLKKHVPNAIQLLVVPITTIVVTGVLALGIIGPVTRHIGDLLTAGLVGVYETVPVVGAILFGALYAPLVITGMHHMFIAIDLQLIAQHGGTFIWPMIALSNIAQGSAALAMFWISKNQNDKSMASTSAISAYFGITEPAMFGVNLRNKFPFYAAIIGSAIAAIFITLNGVLAPAIGIGGLPAFISIIPKSIPMFIVGMIIAIVIPFTLTWLFAKRVKQK
ncbi:MULTISPECIES: PTS system trehalose-specific EIIBC component [Bacillus cereus group]|uniref:PTS system, trehalose-specific IIBC component n=1 Tax=Bacillus thuringiensis TaxID=1428 RepID=A0A1C4A5S7_BACTU|nr:MULTISPECIES: PTS system trehalose-specific EIIBC component [Bacillus cereus group]MED3020805.1 PTS system trehalose-specific EIIBC component [Bacillus wiedmannii]OTY06159.1 PTS trehalose transporter subunit IIBC [Bacillus thuringiensis serovar wratislaviensis]OUB62418.1 trehalose permease IIC protein [Bacillus thuringiensis serovar sylvestriensis]SCB89882.1 PTS system, trehalose-specific IIBC component [Bacillus thuringiensis]